VQTRKSSDLLSTLSMRESVGFLSSDCTLAMYKGLTVTVYTVDKAELTLNHADLVELINVRIFTYYFFICVPFSVVRFFFSKILYIVVCTKVSLDMLLSRSSLPAQKLLTVHDALSFANVSPHFR